MKGSRSNEGADFEVRPDRSKCPQTSKFSFTMSVWRRLDARYRTLYRHRDAIPRPTLRTLAWA